MGKNPKYTLYSIGLNFIKATEICNDPKHKLVSKSLNTERFLSVVKNHSKMVDDMENQIMKYYTEPNNMVNLSSHYLLTTRKASKHDFI